MQVADKTVVIAGLGVSGTSLAEVLRERGTHVIGVDERKPEADLHSFDDVDWDHVDYVMSSPVFNPRTPFVLEAQRRGIPVMSEVEFAWQLRVNNERHRYSGSHGSASPAPTANLHHRDDLGNAHRLRTRRADRRQYRLRRHEHEPVSLRHQSAARRTVRGTELLPIALHRFAGT